MVLLHMRANLLDDFVIGIASRHEPALAVDELRHCLSPSSAAAVVRHACCRYVDETLSKESGGKIQLCGRLVIELGGVRRERLLPGRLGRLLFVFLVLNRTRDLGSAELISALWPGDEPDHAGATLRSLVSKIRRVVEPDHSGRSPGYRLELGREIRIDLEQALAAIHRAEVAVANEEWIEAWGPSMAALFTAQRGFLPGEDAPWISERRRALEDLETRALECYAASTLGIGGGEVMGAERASRRLVEREPYRESGYRLLMRAMAQRGNVADALRVYEQLRALLRDELGISPSPTTQALHVSLLQLG
jgi:SARP family transcriptional regulator, regulator of embCAB operon